MQLEPFHETSVLLSERQKTHGSFADNAAISQALKCEFRESPSWHSLTPVKQEALEMIAFKLSRILSGKADEADHWADIQGYAGLALKEITDVHP